MKTVDLVQTISAASQMAVKDGEDSYVAQDSAPP
jgi:hypothetical protein